MQTTESANIFRCGYCSVPIPPGLPISEWKLKYYNGLQGPSCSAFPSLYGSEPISCPSPSLTLLTTLAFLHFQNFYFPLPGLLFLKISAQFLPSTTHIFVPCLHFQRFLPWSPYLKLKFTSPLPTLLLAFNALSIPILGPLPTLLSSKVLCDFFAYCLYLLPLRK